LCGEISLDFLEKFKTGLTRSSWAITKSPEVLGVERFWDCRTSVSMRSLQARRAIKCVAALAAKRHRLASDSAEARGFRMCRHENVVQIYAVEEKPLHIW